MPSVTQGSTVTTYIYNTLGLNLCPAAQWDALTEDEANQEFGSPSAQLNGPRHWMMDTLEGTGSSNTGQTFTFSGIEMSLRGRSSPASEPPRWASSSTSPTRCSGDRLPFQARQPIYELIDPDRNVYVMQSYAQIVDKELTIDQLPALGHILSLPAGWRYREKRPRHWIQIIATGIAHVINDNLANSYQRITKPGLRLSGVPARCVRHAFELGVQVGGDTANTRIAWATGPSSAPPTATSRSPFQSAAARAADSSPWSRATTLEALAPARRSAYAAACHRR